ncbi:O-acetyl-ADP-ribose deacetylase [Alteromonas sp. ASW11-130]|uniref:O-acetyl-ADP-ribose deacetylase n=1 Tax=Alteromonas sp. ASW11-130 TaxID=3015775 RepID=UPI002242BC02|nr:O-acetyl-ADP-ribose deacetylase [Alteromonas sp. ASW11-130]
MAKIKLHLGDITQLNVDAIVNAANNSLLGGGGVDGAIHRAAGPDLLDFCRTLNGCETGQAKITPAFNLPCRYVIHTVGPIWRGGHNDEPELLQSCYVKCLELARKHKLKTLAFPAISCGIYRYPITEAAKLCIRTIHEEVSQNSGSLETVFLVSFDASMQRIYEQTLVNFTTS